MRALLVFVMLLFFSTGSAQVSEHGSVTQAHTLVSAENTTYTVRVTLPPDFDQNKTYKSLYYLDAWWLSELVTGTYAILNLSEKVEDVVLIGVSSSGNLKDWNSRRTLDLTPSAYDLKKMGFQFTSGFGENSLKLTDTNTGKADRFLAFFEQKLIPFIHAEYPNLNDNRGLVGHSFGGLFCVYALQEKPELFAAYSIISPSMWWNKEEFLKNKLFQKSYTTPKTVFLANGEQESKWITQSNLKLNSIFKNLEGAGFNYRFQTYADQDHNSVLSRALYDSFKMIYGK